MLDQGRVLPTVELGKVSPTVDLGRVHREEEESLG